MEHYSNPSSGADAYEIGNDRIKVRFKRGGTYTYTYGTAGKEAIEIMKELAIANDGLNTYINKNKPEFL